MTLSIHTHTTTIGSVFWATLCALAYFYMVAAWGGYIFIINIIPVHAGFLLFCGRFSSRLYVSYCIFYIIGLISSMQIQFVSFKPVSSPEHYLSLIVFLLFQIYAFGLFLRKLSTHEYERIFLQFSIISLHSVLERIFLTWNNESLLPLSIKTNFVASIEWSLFLLYLYNKMNNI